MTYKGIAGALEADYVKLRYFDVEVKGDGEGSSDPQNETFISEKHAVLFNEGEIFRVNGSHQGIRFLLKINSLSNQNAT